MIPELEQKYKQLTDAQKEIFKAMAYVKLNIL